MQRDPRHISFRAPTGVSIIHQKIDHATEYSRKRQAPSDEERDPWLGMMQEDYQERERRRPAYHAAEEAVVHDEGAPVAEASEPRLSSNAYRLSKKEMSSLTPAQRLAATASLSPARWAKFSASSLKALLSHPNLANIELRDSGCRKAFFAEGRRLTGVTTLIKCFLPDGYDLEKRLYSGRGGVPRARADEELPVPRSCKTTGTAHGTLLHEQLTHYARCMQASGKTAQLFAKKYEEADPCLGRIRMLFAKLNWKLVTADFYIYDPVLQCGTGIDFLCWDEVNKRIIVGELKGGLADRRFSDLPEDAFYAPDSPLADMKVCPKSYCELQLYVTCIILQRNYGLWRGKHVDDLHTAEGTTTPIFVGAQFEPILLRINRRSGTTMVYKLRAELFDGEFLDRMYRFMHAKQLEKGARKREAISRTSSKKHAK